MLKPTLIAATLAGAAAAASLSPAHAQSRAGQAYIEVFGNDPCPRSTDSEVVVCARKPDSERFRIPERLRTGGALQSRQAWANRARSFEIATRRGVNTCDAVGPSGQSGCLQRIIDQAYAETRESETENTVPR